MRVTIQPGPKHKPTSVFAHRCFLNSLQNTSSVKSELKSQMFRLASEISLWYFIMWAAALHLWNGVFSLIAFPLGIYLFIYFEFPSLFWNFSSFLYKLSTFSTRSFKILIIVILKSQSDNANNLGHFWVGSDSLGSFISWQCNYFIFWQWVIFFSLLNVV